jgi:hypothetical protein
VNTSLLAVRWLSDDQGNLGVLCYIQTYLVIVAFPLVVGALIAGAVHLRRRFTAYRPPQSIATSNPDVTPPAPPAQPPPVDVDQLEALWRLPSPEPIRPRRRYQGH